MKMGWRRSRPQLPLPPPQPRCRGVVVAGSRQSCHPRSGFVHHCPRRARYSDSWWPPPGAEEEEDGEEEEEEDAALLIPPLCLSKSHPCSSVPDAIAPAAE